ncbi:MAG: signal recognition particle receptor subunit alpha [Candidatus Marsarchaeota archaeon]|nr:signal recognition particle receptor subunit alpha [Candidatus Marsarchaeota archaeon]MCL5102116.1 signal recognition particle receptor subunit alpha [Candidatus Marsarchaeota archaeon]
MDIGEGIRKAMAKLSRATIIDAKAIKEFNKELQKVLISNDVDVSLVFKLTSSIEQKALKSNPPPGITPHDYITDIVYNELVSFMGSSYEPELKPKRIMLMGLYGSGKTTTAAKLAKYYQDRGLSAGLICCDVTRPSAYEQLETLAKQANVAFFGIKGENSARKIVSKGMEELKSKQVIICDTSGRNAINEQLIAELKEINSEFEPDQKILVLSADIGQVAGHLSEEFKNAVGVSGLIITKMDGSGKGGGALSAANAANAKVMFIGTGEKLSDIEPYNSERFIGSLLGMPDIANLLEKVQNAIKEENINPEEVEVEKLNFESFYAQLKALNRMGPLKSVFGMLGASDMPKDVIEKGEEKLSKYKVIISSMTKNERLDEKLLHQDGRVRRIALGSGTSEKDVRELLSDFAKMKKSFKMLKNDRNMKRFMSRFSN